MRTIKGTIVCVCLSFLAISWPGGTLGLPARGVSLLDEYLTSNSHSQRTSFGSSSSNCDPCGRYLASQNPGYQSRPSVDSTFGDGSSTQKQRLVDLATSLLQEVSSSAPTNQVNTLTLNDGAIETNDVVVATKSSRNVPAISEEMHTSMAIQYRQVRLMTRNSLSGRNAQILQPALDALYKTFREITTGQLLNAELPNLCSKILALNTRLNAIDAPSALQEAVTNFTKSLTVALTGQSQVTLSAVCNCLNDLETSIVTVVENHKSQRLQHLLSHLVDAVTNAVVAGGDVGCNVIDVVQRYVDSMRRAVQEEDNNRAREIYRCVLRFEEQLSGVLLNPDTTKTKVTNPRGNTATSKPGTEEYYLSEIEQLIEKVFGKRTNLVKSAVKILLNVKEIEDQPISSQPRQSTIQSLVKVRNILKSIDSNPQKSSIVEVELFAELLSTFSERDVSKVLKAFDRVAEENEDTITVDDATDIVRNGEFFIFNEHIEPKTDSNGNITVIRNGIYNLMDWVAKEAWGGSFTVQKETTQSGDNGSIQITSSGLYDVILPQSDPSTSAAPRVKRQANFDVTQNLAVRADENGNPIVTETGTFSLIDPTALTFKSGSFEVKNKISKMNPDKSIDVTTAGVLYVNEPGRTSPSVDDDSETFVFVDLIFDNPDRDRAGNRGNGLFNIEDHKTGRSQSGSYVIQKLTNTKNSDGSRNITKSGVIYVDSFYPGLPTENFSPVLIIKNESDFTWKDYVTYETDVDGQVRSTNIGEFIVTDSETGQVTIASYLVENILSKKNGTSSRRITKSGTFTDITALAPSTSSPSNGFGKSPATSPILSSQRTPATKNSYEAFLSLLNPVRPDQLEADDVTTSESLQQSADQDRRPLTSDNDDGSDGSTGKNSTCSYDLASVFEDPTTFIITKLVTPLRNSNGRSVGSVITGTYHLMDIQTNNSWFGSFEVDESTTASVSRGITKETLSGRFDIAPPNDDCCNTIIGEFLVENQLIESVDKSGEPSESGTIRLRDPITNDFRVVNFVVENTLARTRPGGPTEYIKSGYLLPNEPDTTSSSPTKNISIPDSGGFVLFDTRTSSVPDSNGKYGTGLGNIKYLDTDQYATVPYVINKASTTIKADGTLDAKTEGTVDVDGFDLTSTSDRPASPIRTSYGDTFITDDHLTPAIDSHGRSSFIGDGQFSQINPRTKQIQSEDYTILNFFATTDNNGDKIVRTFGVFPKIDDNGDSSTNTQSQTTSEALTSSGQPFALTARDFDTLLESLDPMDPAQSKQQVDANGENADASTIKEPITDATVIPTDGAYFIIVGHIAPVLDARGNTIGQLKEGSFSIRDPVTNVTWPGKFNVEDFSLTSPSKGQLDITASGEFEVFLPGSSNRRIGALFSIKDHVDTPTDKTGIISHTETGTYALTNPITGRSTIGEFVVANSIVQVNPNKTIDILKSGILSVTQRRTPSTTVGPIRNGGYFMTVQNVTDKPDANGLLGLGLYNIKDLKTGEFTSGHYQIENITTVENLDKTLTVTTSGQIFVNSSQSSSLSINSHPSLAISNGARYICIDHLANVTDAYGRVNVVGTGEFYQIDPKTNRTRCGRYSIRDIVSTNNLNDNVNAIEAGIFYYTSEGDSCADLSATSTNSFQDLRTSLISDTSSDKPVNDLKGSFQALIDSLAAFKGNPNPEFPLPAILSNALSAATAKSNPANPNPPDYVMLPRSNVLSASNGQCHCLSPGEVVVVQTNSGITFLATISDDSSPVIFRVTSSDEAIRKTAAAKNVWRLVENDFSKPDRSLFDAVGNPSLPRNT